MMEPDFCIIADTREQLPYEFSCPTLRAKLDAGDYSVAGWETRVAVERKSLVDFATTVIHRFDRFKRELLLLSTYDASCVVVEDDLDAMLRGRRVEKLRGIHPQSILGASLFITQQLAVPVFWCGSRPAACAWTEAFLRMSARRKWGSQDRGFDCSSGKREGEGGTS